MDRYSRIHCTSKSALTLRLTASLWIPVLLLTVVRVGRAQTATDPGVQTCTTCVGGFFTSLNSSQQAIESTATSFFEEVNNVAGGTSTKHVGLGPLFDSNSCNSCHAQPAVGGSSLAANPLFSVYQLMGAVNTMPSFETANGPTVVVRFPYQPDLVTPDGHVHQLFTITGRSDAGTCNIAQPDFATMQAEGNLIMRNTSPSFGGGLVELIPDSQIIANMESNLALKMSLGISGHPNTSGDDGSVTRFGWKAQERSLLTFAGGAYQVEEGVSDDFFPNEENETPGCTPPFPEGPPSGGHGTHGVPDDREDFPVLGGSNSEGFLYPGDPERFAIFMRFLAPPTVITPCPAKGNCTNGETQFNNVGCVLCHTNASSSPPVTAFTTPTSSVSALSNQTVALYSDLLVHDMGPCLADNVVQGAASGDEFRSSPLWGASQRVFFMHDGRTSNIVTAVEDHFCPGNGQYPASEANAVVTNFNNLSTNNQQDLIDFLRSL